MLLITREQRRRMLARGRWNAPPRSSSAAEPTPASLEALVNHIVTHYGTTIVDHVVNTHPDSDHSSGLTVVLERLTVKNLWMHRPWLYAGSIRDRFRSGRITDASLEERIREALNAAHDLEQASLVRHVLIQEPYQGSVIGPFVALSPERAWYLTELGSALIKLLERRIG